MGAEVVEEGIALASSPGRLQIIGSHPTILVDAAHNPHGAESLTRALMTSFSFDRVVCVLGILQEKDVAGIVEALDPVVDHFVVTQSQSDRALSVADLADIVAEIAGPDRVDASPTSGDAMARALHIAGGERGERAALPDVAEIEGAVVTVPDLREDPDRIEGLPAEVEEVVLGADTLDL